MTARAVADLVGGQLHGDPGVEVTGIAAPASATAGSVVFVDDPKRLPEALASEAGVIIAGRFAEAVSADSRPACRNPHPAGRGGPSSPATTRGSRSRAWAASSRRPCHPRPEWTRPRCVHPSARLGAGASIGPRAVSRRMSSSATAWSSGPALTWAAACASAPDSVLRSNVVVYPGTRIGARVIVHAGTVLGSDGFGYVRDESTGRYEAFPQVGRLVIEDDVELGALCTVDRGALGETRIGAGTKLDNQVHVAHNVRVGRNVVIAAQTGIAGSSVIEDNVVVAGQVGIADHVRIESGAILGAQCGVPTGKVIRGPGDAVLGHARAADQAGTSRNWPRWRGWRRRRLKRRARG